MFTFINYINSQCYINFYNIYLRNQLNLDYTYLLYHLIFRIFLRRNVYNKFIKFYIC